MSGKWWRHAAVLAVTAVFCRILLTASHAPEGRGGRGGTALSAVAPVARPPAMAASVRAPSSRGAGAVSMAAATRGGEGGDRPGTGPSLRDHVAGAARQERRVDLAAAWPGALSPSGAGLAGTVSGPAVAAGAPAAGDREHETLPLTGPIPVPGDPALSARVAARWRDESAPLPVAGPVRHGVRHDTQGRYREERATVTAYCPCQRCCGPLARGITSTGVPAWGPGVAADPDRLPYGSRIFVPGYGVATVDDTGGAMRRAWRLRGRLHVDVRMDGHREAREWGRRELLIRVYEP